MLRAPREKRLITAVWTQLARLEVRQKGQGESSSDDVPEKAVLVHRDGFAVVVDQDQQSLPQAAGDYDYAALARNLKRVKEALPDKTDIKTMDVAMAAGFPDLSLLDAARGTL